MPAQDQDIIAANLTAVEEHFHSEAANDIERALDLYTDDIVWEAQGRNLVFRGKKDVADNYWKIFSSVREVEFRNLQRFATDRPYSRCAMARLARR